MFARSASPSNVSIWSQAPASFKVQVCPLQLKTLGKTQSYSKMLLLTPPRCLDLKRRSKQSGQPKNSFNSSKQSEIGTKLRSLPLIPQHQLTNFFRYHELVLSLPALTIWRLSKIDCRLTTLQCQTFQIVNSPKPPGSPKIIRIQILAMWFNPLNRP